MTSFRAINPFPLPPGFSFSCSSNRLAATKTSTYDLLQFGFFDNFYGGILNFSFDSKTASQDFDYSNNRCELTVDVKFQTDISLQG